MSTHKIDWEEMRVGYNRMYKKKHPTVRAFVEAGCRRHGIQVFAEKLGVCGPSVDRIRKQLDLNNQHKIWKAKRQKVQELVDGMYQDPSSSIQNSIDSSHDSGSALETAHSKPVLWSR